jgi:large subunit ribosomal protein L20
MAKGFRGERKNRKRRISETLRKAGVYSYRDRRNKKREFRSLWIVRLNAAARERGSTYRALIGGMKKNNIVISRDVLAAIAADYPQVFDVVFAATAK